jgi:hypothetical protein
MPRSSPRSNPAPGLVQSLKTAIRAALWEHRGSLDTLRDAICAFAADLNAKGTPAADIAATVRAVVAELRTDGEPLAVELAEADPSLDQTVEWCLTLRAGAQNRPHSDDTGSGDRSSRGTSTTEAVEERRRGPDRRNPTQLRGP